MVIRKPKLSIAILNNSTRIDYGQDISISIRFEKKYGKWLTMVDSEFEEEEQPIHVSKFYIIDRLNELMNNADQLKESYAVTIDEGYRDTFYIFGEKGKRTKEF